MRGFLIPCLAAFSAAAQTAQPVPAFGRDNILPHGRETKLMAPGMVLELWGRNLAPLPWCGAEQKPAPPLPHEICGVRVLIGSRPAELMYVSGGQINLKIPEDVPAEGIEPFQVCVGSVCSEPVTMRFSARTALQALYRPAYVRMPVWIKVDAPAPYVVRYPCGVSPWSFPGYEFEVLRNGQPLAHIPPPALPAGRTTLPADTCNLATSWGRLPLHLLYRFDEPGAYAVRFTGKKDGAILYQSDWTEIEIQPFSEEKRDEWLRSLEAEVSTQQRGYRRHRGVLTRLAGRKGAGAPAEDDPGERRGLRFRSEPKLKADQTLARTMDVPVPSRARFTRLRISNSPEVSRGSQPLTQS